MLASARDEETNELFVDVLHTRKVIGLEAQYVWMLHVKVHDAVTCHIVCWLMKLRVKEESYMQFTSPCHMGSRWVGWKGIGPQAQC